MNNNMPNFMIIGAPKSGTTSLDEYLKQHPMIYMSPKKEPYFFAFEDENLDFSGPDLNGKDGIINNAAVVKIEDYHALFDHVSNEIAIGEASTLYLYYPKASERIKHYIPDVKLIAVLRNPVDRAYSAFMHGIRDNCEPITDFSKALEAEKDRIEKNWGPLWRYQDQGLYYIQLKRYFDLFDANQIRVYLYEDFINHPTDLLKDVFRFLGVDESFIPDMSTKHNVTGIPKNRMLYDLLSKPNFITSSLKNFIPQNLRRNIAINLKNANLVKPKLSQELRSQLIEVYKEDVVKLQDLIQRDLSPWLNQ